jgi:hypothetical protein
LEKGGDGQGEGGLEAVHTDTQPLCPTGLRGSGD